MSSEQGKRKLTRRQLIGSSLGAAGALAAGEAILPGFAAKLEAASPAVLEGENKVILFQGDSITDAGRNRRHAGPNNPGAMGREYPFLICSWLLATKNDPELKGLQLRNLRPQGARPAEALAERHHRPEARHPEHPRRRQ